jgi:hypothetical protein
MMGLAAQVVHQELLLPERAGTSPEADTRNVIRQHGQEGRVYADSTLANDYLLASSE